MMIQIVLWGSVMFTTWSIVTACTHLESSRSDWPNWSFVTLIKKKNLVTKSQMLVYFIFHFQKQKEQQYSSYVKQWSKTFSGALKQTEIPRNRKFKQVRLQCLLLNPIWRFLFTKRLSLNVILCLYYIYFVIFECSSFLHSTKTLRLFTGR